MPLPTCEALFVPPDRVARDFFFNSPAFMAGSAEVDEVKVEDGRVVALDARAGDETAPLLLLLLLLIVPPIF